MLLYRKYTSKCMHNHELMCLGVNVDVKKTSRH